MTRIWSFQNQSPALKYKTENHDGNKTTDIYIIQEHMYGYSNQVSRSFWKGGHLKRILPQRGLRASLHKMLKDVSR